MAALPLFTTDSLTLEEFEALVRNTIKVKCEQFHFSLGMWRSAAGKEEENVLLVYTAKGSRKNHVVSLPAKNIRQALEIVNEKLAQI